jgi:tetratricopeptide (TPR) repeat protein
MPDRVPCLDAESACEYVAGTLSPAARAAADEHLEGCAECRRLLEALVITRSADLPAPVNVPRAGRYLLGERLGAGAMGVVYAARDPELARRVALKLLHPRGPLEELRARLLREAQTMARLSHPNVVTIYDVGVADDELYVAMELIEGTTLRAWLAERPRPWRVVLGLFLEAGRGLAAAHAAGIVHRDFKPENVLVRADGQAVVTDFGLARAENAVGIEPPADATLDLTRSGALVGTPAYMSAEQLRGARADARSDQFAFCVALFEGLAGNRPFAGASLAELAQNVVSGRVLEPPRRVPAHLRRPLLRGLSVDREARYPTMEALLADLGRDPWRPWRRAAAALGVAAALGAVGLAVHDRVASPRCEGGARALAGVWDDARRAGLEQRFAGMSRAYAGAALGATLAGLDDYAAAWRAARREVCLGAAPDAPARDACLDDRLRELGALVNALDAVRPEELDKAAPAARGLTRLETCANARAVGVAEPFDPGVRQAVAAVRAQLVALRARWLLRGPRGLADPAALVVVQARALGFRPLVAEAVYLDGNVADGDHAYPLLEDAVLAAEAAGDDDVQVHALIDIVSNLAVRRVLPDAAEQALRHANALVERLGNEPALRARLVSAVGQLRYIQGRYADALLHFQEAAGIYTRLAGPSSYEALRARGQGVGPTLQRLGRYPEALAELSQTVTLATAALGPGHPLLAPLLRNLGDVDLQLDHFEDGIAHLRAALAVTRETAGPGSSREAGIESELGAALFESGHDDEAAPHLRAAYELARKRGDQELIANTGHNLAPLLEKTQPAEAEAVMREVLAAREKALGPKHPRVALALTNLGTLLRAHGRAREALPLFERARAIEDQSLEPTDVQIPLTRLELARALIALNRFGDALREAQAAVAEREKLFGPGKPQVASALLVQAQAEHGAGRRADAVAHFEAVLATPAVEPDVASEARALLARRRR